jgi:hypothetical protein
MMSSALRRLERFNSRETGKALSPSRVRAKFRTQIIECSVVVVAEGSLVLPAQLERLGRNPFHWSLIG